jgi:DNA-binding NarL/FixJ family response regulator
MKNLKVIVVENNMVFRKTFVKFLIEELSASVIAELDNQEELLTLSNICNAEVIFINKNISGTERLETIKMVLWNYPYLKMINISGFSDFVYLKSLVEAGFKGFIDSDNVFNDLNIALENVMKGQYFFSNSIAVNLHRDR